MTENEHKNLCLQLRPDPPSESGALEFGNLNFKLHLHPDVLEDIHDQVHLKKRLAIILNHLAAYGRTTVVKGCKGNENDGWLRSPLGGGSNGMQYYLWWTRQGTPPVKSMNLSDGDIIIRALRHHDNHEALTPGLLDSYLTFAHKELEDQSLVGRPWTDEQLSFVSGNNPVRVILGRPGAGKTMALWKAIEARSNQKVLYLTWSRELTEHGPEN
jgi:hypothetical protein